MQIPTMALPPAGQLSEVSLCDYSHDLWGGPLRVVRLKAKPIDSLGLGDWGVYLGHYWMGHDRVLAFWGVLFWLLV